MIKREGVAHTMMQSVDISAEGTGRAKMRDDSGDVRSVPLRVRWYDRVSNFCRISSSSRVVQGRLCTGICTVR